MSDCPDESLCEKLGRHIHGRIYELYTTDEKFRKIIDQDGPTFLQKAKNLAASTFTHIKHGLKLVSDNKQNERLQICRSCSELKEDNSCRLCGCDVNLKTKWASEKCPADKWLEESVGKGCGCG